MQSISAIVALALLESASASPAFAALGAPMPRRPPLRPTRSPPAARPPPVLAPPSRGLVVLAEVM